MRLISVPMYVTVSIIGINHQPEDVQLLHLIAFRFFSLELAVHVYHLQWPACLPAWQRCAVAENFRQHRRLMSLSE
jgi:hypothetical protein